VKSLIKRPVLFNNFFSRPYLGGLLGESEEKKPTQTVNNAVGVIYNRLHHFLMTECDKKGKIFELVSLH